MIKHGEIAAQPFRSVGAKLYAGRNEVREDLSGGPPGVDLQRWVDLSGGTFDPPPQGVTLTGRMARDLGVKPGDRILAQMTEGRRQILPLSVAAVLDSPFGSSAVLDRRTPDRLLLEGDTLSGALSSGRRGATTAHLCATGGLPMVAGITSRKAALSAMEAIIQGNFAIRRNPSRRIRSV